MKTLFNFLMALWPCFVMTMPGCNNSDDDSDSSNNGGDSGSGADTDYTIKGLAQKGPFINGSKVTAAELDNNLEQTGDTFTSEISDDLGTFEISPSLSTSYAELIVDGFFFDEISGALSKAPISLRALDSLDDGTDINVNVLTHLAGPRMETLMESGRNFSDAKSQSKAEVLAIFHIDSSNLEDFHSMDIFDTGQSNAALLAVSAILMEMAHARDPNSAEAELSAILSAMITDIGADGTLDSESMSDEIADACMNLDMAAVRTHLENRMDELGQTGELAGFEEMVDTDFDGVPESTDDNMPEPFYFLPVVNADTGQEYISNEVVVSGLGQSGFALLSLRNPEDEDYYCQSASIIINEEETSETVAEVVNGDKVKIRIYLDLEFDFCDVTLGNFSDRFAVTTLPHGSEAVAQGTKEDPVVVENADDNDHPYLASVDTSVSYYEIYNERATELLYIYQSTKMVDFYLYDNAEFEGEPFCSSEEDFVRRTSYCDLPGSEPIYLKVDGSKTGIGSFYTLYLTI